MSSRHGASETRLNRIIAIWLGIFGGISCLLGILLLSTYNTTLGYEIVKDYTDCTTWENQPNEKKCKDKLNATGKECSCYIPIMITVPMQAPVTVYYELDFYDEIINKYSQSRDDNQLAGHLSVELSESCGSHTYDCTATGRKPIAPCGGLADAMFNDSFSLQINNSYVMNYYTGLIPEDEKKQFRNPDSAVNLTQAFREFTKPISWRKNVWELDLSNPNNNGFQNEALIIWMKTDLKRKPAFRVNHEGKYKDGLPVGIYSLRVKYNYRPSGFDGRRKVIISSIQHVVNTTQCGFGVTLLVIGLACFIVAALLLFRKKK